MTNDSSPRPALITYNDFLNVDIRVGTVIAAELFPEARKPAYKLTVDFGAVYGVRRTSAQITQNYSPENLVGKQVAGVVNFPAKQIGPFMSEFLVLGFPDAKGHIVLVMPASDVPNGGRLL